MSQTCKDCTKRKLGCHIDCEEYNAFVQERQEEYKKKSIYAATKYNPSVERNIKRSLMDAKRRGK